MTEPLDVLIVGAGISGIGMAAHLTRECPGKRYAIVDRRAAAGGTWDLFRYPGVRSDSDMFTLGYAFAPWREDRSIVGGETILGYLGEVIDSHGIADRIHFGLTVTSADWDSRAGLWTVRLTDGHGKATTMAARFLFAGAGYYDYDDPHDAQIPGLDSFGGLAVHPQFWPDDLDYAGKRIVVIGSGATAATLVPALAEKAALVTMLQRTPTWYITRPARDGMAAWLRRLLPDKAAYALTRLKNVRMQNYLFGKSRSAPEGMKAFLHKQIEDQLGSKFDPEAFTPPYNPWEQRMCLIPDGDLFDAIREGKAEIVTARIAQVDQTGILLDDGRHLDADIIITATGLRLTVLGGITLNVDGEPVNPAEHFFYRNCMFSNVPNFAMLFGYLNASWTLRVDLVAEWLCKLLRHMDKWGVDVATPYLPVDHGLIETHPFDAFSSGYLQRARAQIPKSATTSPWQIGMDYLTDRKEVREAPIDDGVMRFERTAQAVASRGQLS
ncbi:NAD(P)/FAD-dependent oxidoreductase [Novosphingobium sp. G106]|uniref:flavin-containing monooxygenase n=1 Tax=Novosphingobium sp. G106 TaxID=2849500 RepID=UPI001C2D3DAE|nr:NAD(P)/FAD-dependent oxidoreductase [Novosphingobium sp. G106]MBV1688676.1 NAD(P)/FAD-dependent oxidoreductase [Novosphingobium sp. G106]